MKTLWVQLVDTLHKAKVEQVKAILSALQIEVLLMLNDYNKILNICNMDTLDNLSKISEKLKVLSLSVGELVPATQSLKLQLTYEGKEVTLLVMLILQGTYFKVKKKTSLIHKQKKSVVLYFLDVMKAASITQLLQLHSCYS